MSGFFAAILPLHAAGSERIEVREVGIRKKTNDVKGNAPGLTPDQASRRADAIRKSLQSGTGFAEIAAKFAVPHVVVFKTDVVRRGDLPPQMEPSFDQKDGDVFIAEDKSEDIVLVQGVRRVQGR